MLKKLRRKILSINMCLVSMVLLLSVLMLLINSVNTAGEELFRGLRQEANLGLRDGQQTAHLGQQEDPPDIPASVPHITALLLENGMWDIRHNDGVSIDTDSMIRALTYARDAEEDEAILNPLRLAYVRRQTPQGLLVVLGDTTMVRVTLQKNLLYSAFVLVAGLVIFFVISLWLSRIAVQPIAQSWQQQKRFIADASHELKTPLTVILANSHIIASHPTETVAQQEKWLRSTEEEAKQMRHLVDEMLTLAKTEDEQTVIHLQPTNISDLIEEEILFLEPVAYEKNVLLETDLEKDLIWNTDPVLLTKLLVILVDNAIKHGSSGTTVTIRLSGGRTAALSVHNYGPAIALEDQAHLFDRFFRSDKSRSTEGHGLGLSIAQSVSKRLKGRLTVASSEEYGTTFTVEFKNG